jgi:hypothetical protein
VKGAHETLSSRDKDNIKRHIRKQGVIIPVDSAASGYGSVMTPYEDLKNNISFLKTQGNS